MPPGKKLAKKPQLRKPINGEGYGTMRYQERGGDGRGRELDVKRLARGRNSV